MTVDDVCAEARLSKGAFYGYFEQKRDLMVALLEDDARDLDAILDTLGNRSISNIERIRGYTQALLERGGTPGRAPRRADLVSSLLSRQEVAARLWGCGPRLRSRLGDRMRVACRSGEAH